MQYRGDRQGYIERELTLVTFNTDPPQPERSTTHFFPLYETLSFRSWFIDYPRLDELPLEQRAVICSYTFTGSQRPDEKTLVHTFHWLVKLWVTCNFIGPVQRRYDHFRNVYHSNPILHGDRHSNRFLRGTKLLITKGEYRGKHGVVIGHLQDFKLFKETPKLRVILADLSIVTVSQSSTFLLDLHHYLPFALPFDPDNIPRPWDWGETPVFRDHRLIHYQLGWENVHHNPFRHR